MPIYEFYCEECNTIFNFFSKRTDTDSMPKCPKCKTNPLKRQISLFAFTGKAKEGSDIENLPFDESKMEQVMGMLAGEAEHIDENDSRKAAQLMRKLSDMTGLQLRDGMNEALSRMESGEDPDKIEADMGDIIDSEEPFLIQGRRGLNVNKKRPEPLRDETLYDL